MLYPSLSQQAFRYRNDDGDEAGATWSALLLNENPVDPAQAGTEFRCRFVIVETNGEIARSSTFSLISRVNGGTWLPLADVNSSLTLYDSAFIIGTPVTTQQLSSGSFTAGELYELGAAVDTISIEGGSFCEIELCFVLDPDQFGKAYNDGDTIEFALAYGDQTLLENYDVLPSFVAAEITEFSRIWRDGVKLTEFHMDGVLIPQMFYGDLEIYRNKTV